MLRHWNILCVVVVVVFCVRCVLHHTGGLANSGEDLHSNCKMADASRGPGRPPKKRSGSKKAENVPGAKLQKSQREKGRRVRKYLMEQSKVKEQGTEQGEKSLYYLVEDPRNLLTQMAVSCHWQFPESMQR